MRKFILITAMVLASATAQAGASRSLSLSVSEPPVAAPAKPVDQKPVDQKAVERIPAATTKAVEAPATSPAPAPVARPATVATISEAPKYETRAPVTGKTARTAAAYPPKRKNVTMAARVMHELHRHGIICW